MQLERKLQIKPGQSVAVVNAPSGSALAALSGHADPSQADAIIGCAARRAELPLLEAVFDAARADRLAWISYPKAGQLGTDLNRDRRQ